MSSPPFNVSLPTPTWQLLQDWAQSHYRDRTFSKDERVPSRPGLLYLVEQGAVRLVGGNTGGRSRSRQQLSIANQKKPSWASSVRANLLKL